MRAWIETRSKPSSVAFGKEHVNVSNDLDVANHLYKADIRTPRESRPDVAQILEDERQSNLRSSPATMMILSTPHEAASLLLRQNPSHYPLTPPGRDHSDPSLHIVFRYSSHSFSQRVYILTKPLPINNYLVTHPSGCQRPPT